MPPPIKVAPTAQSAVPPEAIKLAPITQVGSAPDRLPITTRDMGSDLQNYALSFETDVENYMATNQSRWGLFGKALGQTVSEAVLGTVEGGSYLLDVEQMIQKLQGDEEEYTNWLAEAMKEGKEAVSEDLLKVYKTKEAQTGFAPGDATWWAANTGQTIGTALSLMVPGMGAAGAAGKAAKLVKAGSNAIKISEAAAATVASRYAESTMEARGVYEKTYAELKRQYPMMPEEELSMKAGKAASKTWNSNWVFAASDFLQYATIFKGLKSASKGKLGTSIGEVAKQMVSEAGEEAGQYLVSEEAYNSVINGTDYFGHGFSDRLANYIQEPEFQASTLLGGVGGGVFAGAGAIGDKLVNPNEPVTAPEKLQETIKKQVAKVAKKGVEKEAANYAGNTGKSMAIDNDVISKKIMANAATGKLDQMSNELTAMQKTVQDNDARESVNHFLKDVEYIKDEQAKMKSSGMESALQLPILAQKLEQRQLARLEDHLQRSLSNTKEDVVKNKQMSADVLPLKQELLNAQAYEELSKLHPQLAEKAKAVREAFNAHLLLTGLNEKALYTPQDKDLLRDTLQLISTQEKREAIGRELASLDTKEGLASYKEKLATKALEAKIATSVKASTSPESLEYLNALLPQVENRPDLKAQVEARIEELKTQVREGNKDKVVEAANQAIEQEFPTEPEFPEEPGFEEWPTEPEFPESNSQQEGDTYDDPVDLLLHAININLFADAGDVYSRRLELGMTKKDIEKGVSDIKKRNFGSKPAQKLLSKFKQFIDQGYFPFTQGAGNSVHRTTEPLPKRPVEAPPMPTEPEFETEVTTPETPVVTEPEWPTTLTREEATKLYGPEEANKMFERLNQESPNTPKPAPVEKQEKEKEATKTLVDRKASPTFLKELQRSPTKGNIYDQRGVAVLQEWHDNDSGQFVPATEVFETDEMGNLIVNTPLVQAGGAVVLKVENDFKYTITPGFKSTSAGNAVINVYLKGHLKPIAQLPSLNAPQVAPAHKAVLAELRRNVLNAGTFETIISSKTPGELRQTGKTLKYAEKAKHPELLSLLDSLEFDYYLDNAGKWRLGRTPHKPILGIFGRNGALDVPGAASMAGANKYTREQLKEVQERLRKGDIKPGTTVVLRTSPLGQLQAVPLFQRKLNEAEKGWIVSHLADHLLSGDIKSLSHLISIKAEKPGILKQKSLAALSGNSVKVVEVGTNRYELLIPMTNAQRGNKWVRLTAGQAKLFLEGKPFAFKGIDRNGETKGVFTSATISEEAQKSIHEAFNRLLSNMERNVSKDLINSEQNFTDDVTGQVYSTYYEFLSQTGTLTTDIIGTKVQGNGRDSGFSFENSTFYLDPSPNKAVKVEENEIVIAAPIIKPEERGNQVLGKPIFYSTVDLKKVLGQRFAEAVSGIESSIPIQKQKERIFKAGVGKAVQESIGNGTLIQNKKTGVLYVYGDSESAADFYRGEDLLKYEEDGLNPEDFFVYSFYPVTVDSNGQIIISDAYTDKVPPIFGLQEDKLVKDFSIVGEIQQDKPSSSINKALEAFDDPYAEQTRPATAPGFQTMTDKEIEWFKEHIGSEFLSVAKGVDRILTKGGVEAFGIYHRALVRLAELGEIGTAYHEAFHFVMDNILSDSERGEILKHGTEEEMAEQFRAYMLSDGKVKPKQQPVRSFFAKLIAAIKNLIGMKAPIEKIFDRIATQKLTEQERAAIGSSLFGNIGEEVTRLLPGMPNYARQEEIVMTAAHNFMEFVRAEAEILNMDYEDVIANKADVDKFFDKLKERYSIDMNRIAMTPQDKWGPNDTQRFAVYLTMGLSPSIPEFTIPENMVRYQGIWEDTKGKLTPGSEQKETGFKTEVIKSLSKFGYTVTVRDMSTEEEDELAELRAEDEQERIHDIEHTLISPSKLLSQRIKAFLSTIPEPEIDNKGQIVLKENGEQAIKTSILGTPKYIDFQKVYRNLVGKLADSGTPMTRLEKLAQADPIMRAVYDALAKEVAGGNTRLLAEFNTKLNLVRHPYVTLIYGYTKEGGVEAKVIYTDRSDMATTLVNRWREAAVRTKLIDTAGVPNTGKVDYLLRKIKEAKPTFATKIFKAEDAQALAESLLAEMGIRIKPQVWQEIMQRRTAKTDMRSIVFGTDNASLEHVLSMAEEHTDENGHQVPGRDPFADRGTVFHYLANLEKQYVDDVRADVFLNESNKQVNSINTPSWLAEFFVQAKEDKEAILSKYEQDRFYNGNEFLKVIKESPKSFGFSLVSALRRSESKAKEFKNRTSTDSYVSRLIAFYNGGLDTKSGFFFVGTLSDKSKQVLVTLPKKSKAKDFLKSVLMQTAANEVARIQRMKHLPFEIKDYSANGRKFNYTPELNDIPGLAESLKNGDLTPEAFKANEQKASETIDKAIDNMYAKFLVDMEERGLITRNSKTGAITATELMPEALRANVAIILPSFFYHDVAWRTEMSKVFHGDMAQYKDADAYYKRGYQIVTPGLKSWNDPNNSVQLVRAVYQGSLKENTDDYVLSLAQLMDPSVKSLSETSKQAVQIARKYKKGLDDKGVNKTDAQSLCTVATWKKIMTGLGEWTKDHELVYDTAWKHELTVAEAIREHRMSEEQEKNLRRAAAKIIMQPLKPFQLADREITLANGETIVIKEQFKDSIAPLIPEFAWMHNLDSEGYAQMLRYMLDHGIDIMSAHDTAKVGLYGVIGDLRVAPEAHQLRTISLNDIRIPQLIPNKVKEEVTMLTQFWKLLLGNVQDPKIINEFNKLWNERIQGNAEELRKELGLGPDYKLSEDKETRARQLLNLQTVLRKQLLNRDLNDNYADAIRLVTKAEGNPEFTLDPGFPSIAHRFIGILTGMFKNRILKSKEPGYSMINLADYGISQKERNSHLHFIRNDNGEVVEAEVGMPLSFFKDIKLKPGDHFDIATGKIIWEKLNKNQQEALQMIMVRIPTSNKSSMLPVRVAMVLPSSMGSTIMVPGEGTLQQGFDFDVDKSNIIRRVIDSEGKVNHADVDTRLFNLAWGVLTDKKFTQEMLTPLAAPTLEAKVEQYKQLGLISSKESDYVLSTTVDVKKEEDNKQAKAGIGIASRFNTGHAMMQMLKEQIKLDPNAGVNIKVKDYQFNELGRIYDNEGNLISNNHAQIQHAELDAAKDPLLSRLGVPSSLLPVVSYMVSTGVSLNLAIDFMNQPVIKQWIKYYNQTGGNNPTKATKYFYEKFPSVKAQLAEFRKDEVDTAVTPGELVDQLTKDPNTWDLESQSAVLAEFLHYQSIASSVSKLNTLLSVDTFSDMTGIEALEEYLNIRTELSKPDSPILISPSIFDPATAPPVAKRLAAFYKYAIDDAIALTSQFSPYVSNMYVAVKDAYTSAVGSTATLKKDSLNSVNKFLDFYTLQTTGRLLPVMQAISPEYTKRWSYFEQDRSFWNYIQKTVAKYPVLSNNALIQALEPERYRQADKVQMVGVVNTNSNLNKNAMRNAWWDMLNSANADIKQLANDLIRFSVYTSGFGYNTRSFTDLIPVEFWVQSGIADQHKAMVKGLTENSIKIDIEGAVTSYIRHSFSENDDVQEVVHFKVEDKSVSDMESVRISKDSDTHLTGFSINKSSELFNRIGRTIPTFVKHWDSGEKKYRLYEAKPLEKNDEVVVYQEIQPLGEPGAMFEIKPDGRNASAHPSNTNSGKPIPVWSTVNSKVAPVEAKPAKTEEPAAAIPQNLVSGTAAFGTLQHAKPEIVKALGQNPHSIDMIAAGFRTRTTRSVGEMEKYNIKVGDVVKHYGRSKDGSTKSVLARVTAIYPKGSPEFDNTWKLEGWTDEGRKYTDRLKPGAAAVVFEVIKPTEKLYDIDLYSFGTKTEEETDWSNYVPGDETMPEIVLQRLIEKEENPEHKKLMQAMYRNAEKLGNTRVVVKAGSGYRGYFDVREGVIAVNRTAGEEISDKEQRRVLFHELLHAYLSGVIWDPRTTEELNFVRNMTRAWEKAKKLDPNYKEIHDPKTGLQEFVARIGSEKALREKLKKADIWNTIKRLIRKLFGFKDSFDAVLEDMYNTIETSENIQRDNEGRLYMKDKKQKETPQARKRLDLLETILMGLHAREKRLRAFGQHNSADQLHTNIEKLSELAGIKRNEFILKYILLATEEIKKLQETLLTQSKKKVEEIHPGLLQAIEEQLTSYTVLEDIKRQLYRYPERYAPSESAAKALLEQFSKLEADISRMKVYNRDLIIDYVAHRIKQVTKNEDLKIEDIKDRLIVADRDISWWNKLMDPMADSSDEALAALDKIVKEAYAEGDRKMVEKLHSYETQAETTEYKVNPFKAGTKVSYTATGLHVALTHYEEWLKKNGKSTNTIADKFMPVINKETLRKGSKGIEFISPTSVEGKAILMIPEGSPNYPLKEFYSTYVLGYLKAQENIKLPSLRPGLRIPSIERSLIEGVMRDSGLSKVGAIGRDMLHSIQRKYDEAEFQAVDEEGRPQEYLPVRFVARQDGKDGRLSSRDVSLDIATTVAVFMNEMYNHAELTKVLPDAELFKGVLERREVQVAGGRTAGKGLAPVLTRDRKAITDPVYGKVQTIAGSESQAFKQADAFIRRVVYGRFKKDAGSINVFGQKLDVRKSVDRFMKFTGLRILFGNLAIPLTNVGMGHIYMMREAIGANLINMKDWAAGQKFYKDVLPDAVRDLGNRVKTTKLGRVYAYFNPLDNNRPFNHLGIDTNWMMTIGPRIGTSLQESTEFNLAATAMGAVFNRFKATNPAGEEVSLYEALEVTMDGKVSLAKGYKYKGKSSITGKDIDEVRDYTLRLYQNMNGVYNKLDSAVINETVAGSLIMFMRRWLPSGIATAYRLRYFDERFGKENEGNFISAMILFNNIFTRDGMVEKTVRTLRALFWMDQTDPELLLHPNELGLPQEKKDEIIALRRANMRKTLFTLYTIVGMTALLMTAWDDDDDSYTRYMIGRMRRELMTFTNPITAWDVLRSPTVALSSITAITRAIGASLDATGAVLTGEDVKIMQQGKGKGQEEWWYRMKQASPLLWQLDQMKDLDTSTRLIVKGGIR